MVGRGDQLEAGDGQRGRYGVAERPVLLVKPGNAGGGKGPQFKTGAESGKPRESGATLANSDPVLNISDQKKVHFMLSRRAVLARYAPELEKQKGLYSES